jgi:2,3-bisphosphoglycerate-independent phosphoglycerate mutase
MKYVLLVPDGMADDPLEELNGRTPLEAARTPNMDALAAKGTVGLVSVTPPGMYPGSDSANMALLGYDPVEHYSGRGPVEATAMGVPMDPRDVAFRCSLVTTDGEKMLDYSSGHITTDEARPLIEFVASKLGTRHLHFYPGVSYRHVLLWNDGPVEMETFPPHENIGTSLSDILPVGAGQETLRQLIWDSFELLDAHPFNRQRRDEGKNPANTLWPWGQGRVPRMEPFSLRYGHTGAVIAAVDVVRGLGRLVGLEVVQVPGATGYFDTDYASKALCALDALDRHDFVWVHVEAPDEAGHAGSIDEKVKAIESIDRLVLGRMLEGLRKLDDCRILIAADHYTPIATRGHRSGPLPYLLFDSRHDRSNRVPFDERALHENVRHLDEGYRLIGDLFGR